MNDPVVLPEIVEQWLAWLGRDRGRSENTVKTYARTMRTLTEMDFDLIAATPADLEQWWKTRAEDREGNPRPHSSRNNELAAVRAFYKWLQRFDYIVQDPTRRLDVLRGQKRISKFIGQSDLDHLLTHLGPEMRRAVALGAYGGLRVSEAASLSWADVNQETRRVTVRGKGNQERVIPLPTKLLDILLPEIDGGNVVSGSPEAYTAHWLQIKVNEAMRRNGVALSFHKLRHRYGFMAASKGNKPTAIAAAMGHANLQTTMGYIATVDDDLDRIGEAVTA